MRRVAVRFPAFAEEEVVLRQCWFLMPRRCN